MIKNILSFAAAAIISLDASAGYIQYNLSGGGLEASSPYNENILVIREEDKSVAFFAINTVFHYFGMQDEGENYHENSLLKATTSFRRLGPTNMYMADSYIEERESYMWLKFKRGNGPKTFKYNMRIVTGPAEYAPYPEFISEHDVTFSGTATQVTIDPDFAERIDYALQHQWDMPRIVPTFVGNRIPEPGSLALMAIGLLGGVGVARRKSKA